MVAVLPPRPLAQTDDRLEFDCGRPSLNGWFQRHALRNHMANTSRVSVLCEAASGRIVGYVALCAAQIERGFLAKAMQRNQPDPFRSRFWGSSPSIKPIKARAMPHRC